ncbi:CinA family protein [Rhodococcus rhodnii]|uniref:Competence-damage inducible protein n=2 Tax=Rhodococcus rhodnii TaxID=38312 RepID=R7WW27_9NOCA|nr:CinA family protein [Rhodococcus rhodnii]EOM78334.1 competence-damage inducible protein [Rhodococcus rhodnii LMG 5362]TXG91173.1 CinA family protein [Rhodococcus rhodnii]
MTRDTARIADLAGRSGLTVAVAESLTGGQVSCALAAAPGSSDWYRGAIVSYSKGVKRDLLAVPDGPVVSRAAVEAMATNAARLLGADLALAVTGAGGPEGQDGAEPGTVWVALARRGECDTERHVFSGEPGDIVEKTCDYALDLLAAHLHRYVDDDPESNRNE